MTPPAVQCRSPPSTKRSSASTCPGSRILPEDRRARSSPMNILMVTNTFTPYVGGVANSVASFAAEYRRQGHRVLVVAPEFRDAPGGETDVIRVPAIQRFNGSDFSLRLPVPGFLFPALDRFRPDVVHSHHPYLLGDTALRIAAVRNAPLVFTHHSMYETFTR